jgi:hypothetical protein
MLALSLISMLLFVTVFGGGDMDYDYGKVTESIFLPSKMAIINKAIRLVSFGHPDTKVGKFINKNK